MLPNIRVQVHWHKRVFHSGANKTILKMYVVQKDSSESVAWINICSFFCDYALYQSKIIKLYHF